MTLTEPLEELRWCLLKSFAAIILASGLCYFFSDAIFKFMVAPLRQSLRPGQSLIGTAVTEAFFVEIKVALAGGVFFCQSSYFLSDLALYQPRSIVEGEEAGIAVCLLCNPFFSRRDLFLLPYRSSRCLSVFHRAIRDDRGNAGNTYRGIFYFFFPYGFSLWCDLRVAGFHLFLSASGHFELS